MHDILNRVREVALHGVRHGAATALAAAQAHSGQNLQLLPHGFPDAAYPGEQERLVEDFMSVADSVASNTLADDIVGKVFPRPVVCNRRHLADIFPILVLCVLLCLCLLCLHR